MSLVLSLPHWYFSFSLTSSIHFVFSFSSHAFHYTSTSSPSSSRFLPSSFALRTRSVANLHFPLHKFTSSYNFMELADLLRIKRDYKLQEEPLCRTTRYNNRYNPVQRELHLNQYKLLTVSFFRYGILKLCYVT